MNVKMSALLFSLTVLIMLSSCAAKHPVLYPNAHLTKVGDAAARQDIDECMQLAAQYGARQNKGGEIARDTAESSVIGGVSGAATGAVFDNAGKGAAAGAAGAGAAVLTRGLFRSHEPDPVFRNFVERCLRDRGYEPIGWQ